MRLGGFEFLEPSPEGVAVPDAAPEHRVDETALPAKASLAGQLHGFVDCGMVRDAVEPKDLVEPEAQEVLQARVLGAAVCSGGDEPVQCGLPPHDAVNQFLAQASVGGGE